MAIPTDGYTRYCTFLADGTIVRTGNCVVDSVALQVVHAGETSIPCSDGIRSGTHKVTFDGGGNPLTIVPITQADLDARAAVVAAIVGTVAAAIPMPTVPADLTVDTLANDVVV